MDGDNIAVIGFCFGGTGAYNMARYETDAKIAISMVHPPTTQTLDSTPYTLHHAPCTMHNTIRSISLEATAETPARPRFQ